MIFSGRGNAPPAANVPPFGLDGDLDVLRHWGGGQPFSTARAGAPNARGQGPASSGVGPAGSYAMRHEIRSVRCRSGTSGSRRTTTWKVVVSPGPTLVSSARAIVEGSDRQPWVSVSA